ncbi:hypothetical protein H920_08920 [Fukomys damarensis]|uniref:Uncharacterized protein n=1 Tax=Fukomys damarensis TaxID=885580 RepID=A0A091DHM8_FUKDA|nr:hypothetical protein H920_08920 [Fukomys damarensis]
MKRTFEAETQHIARIHEQFDMMDMKAQQGLGVKEIQEQKQRMGLTKNLAFCGKWAREVWCYKNGLNNTSRRGRKVLLLRHVTQETNGSVPEPEVFTSSRDQR